MLKDWFFGKIEKRAIDSSTLEMDKFVIALKEMEDKDLGMIVAVATVMRVNFETNDILAEDLFGEMALPSTEALGKYQQEINRVSRELDKMGLASDAFASMIWSYTLCSLNVPELRPLGLEMWGALQRGFPYVEEALKYGEEKREEKFPTRVWGEWKMIPVGFEGD